MENEQLESSREPSASSDMQSIVIAYVCWKDAHADSGWMRVGDVEDVPYIVHTVGLLVKNMKSGHISVAQSFGAEEGLVDYVLHIPYEMVDSV